MKPKPGHAKWGVPLALALLAIAARALLATERVTWLGIARTVVIGSFVGASMNVWLIDEGLFTDGTRGAVVGVSAVLAEDLLMALLRVGRRFAADPFLPFNWALSAFTKFGPIPEKKPDEPKV